VAADHANSVKDRTPAEAVRPEPWPTDGQLLAALHDAAADGQVAMGWRGLNGMLFRLTHARQAMAGQRAVVRLLDRELPTLVPDGHLWAGVRVQAFRIVAEQHTRQDEATNYYARLAQAAIEDLAAGQIPGLYAGKFPGESLDIDWTPDNEPDPAVPAAFEGIELLAAAMARFSDCDAAREEYTDLYGCDCESPEECDSYHVPEHAIEHAAALEERMNRWMDYLADFGDAIVYVLCTELRPRLHAGDAAARETAP
jgi:hypothetical protein